MVWIQFAVCAILVVIVGSMLSLYADILAEKTGLGHSWVGGVLLAGATSLPELATGVSAVTVVGDVNLAAGGVLGSCLFNLLLIAFFDMICGPRPLMQRAAVSHILAAGLGSVLLTIVMLSLYMTQTLALPTLRWIGLPSILILSVYVVGVRLISSFEKRRMQEALAQEAAAYQYAAISLRRAALVFGLLSAAIVALGLWLATLGDQIAETTGLGASFVGAIFLAVTTSMPEIVAGAMAIRIGAVDLAVSNVFGSNIFNIAALAIYDIVNLQGNLWMQLGSIHGFTAVAATLMTMLAIISLIYRTAKRPRWHISWDGLLLMILYTGSMYVVYRVTL